MKVFEVTGLVNYSVGIQSEMLAMNDLNNAYKGAITPNKKPYLLMNLPYYAGTSLPQYIEWFVKQEF